VCWILRYNPLHPNGCNVDQRQSWWSLWSNGTLLASGLLHAADGVVNYNPNYVYCGRMQRKVSFVALFPGMSTHLETALPYAWQEALVGTCRLHCLTPLQVKSNILYGISVYLCSSLLWQHNGLPTLRKWMTSGPLSCKTPRLSLKQATDA
jgi:hypothetical protein